MGKPDREKPGFGPALLYTDAPKKDSLPHTLIILAVNYRRHVARIMCGQYNIRVRKTHGVATMLDYLFLADPDLDPEVYDPHAYDPFYEDFVDDTDARYERFLEDRGIEETLRDEARERGGW